MKHHWILGYGGGPARCDTCKHFVSRKTALEDADDCPGPPVGERILADTRIETYSHGIGPTRYAKTTATHDATGTTITRENTPLIVVQRELVRLVQEKEHSDQAD